LSYSAYRALASLVRPLLFLFPNLTVAVAATILTSAPLYAANEQVFVTQSPTRHIIAHVSASLPGGCVGTPTNLGFQTPDTFLLYTDLYTAGCVGNILPYSASVDLGLVTDGDRRVDWQFVEDGFGPVGTIWSRLFSIRNGVLVSNDVPIPSLSRFSVLALMLLVGLSIWASRRFDLWRSIRINEA